MRITKALAASLLSLALLTAACGSDNKTVDAGSGGTADDINAAPGGAGVEMPDSEPDLVGTITTVSPFEPITENCTPADEVDPNAAVSSDDPPICTPDDNNILGTILVEEKPDDPQAGNKISYTITTDTKIAGTSADGVGVGVFADLAEGQTADTWVAGDVCADSYPQQCGLEAIRITG